jgi:hypothetical protein
MKIPFCRKVVKIDENTIGLNTDAVFQRERGRTADIVGKFGGQRRPLDRFQVIRGTNVIQFYLCLLPMTLQTTDIYILNHFMHKICFPKNLFKKNFS